MDMNDLNFINYFIFFKERINARQILFCKKHKGIGLNDYREKIARKISIDVKKIAIPIQVHSNKVKFINRPGFFEDTDGLITSNQDIILSLQTADCMPIFLFDKFNGLKGLIHSGWRGTKDKIIENALNIMLENNSDLSNIKIVIGASIHKCCYEIGLDLVPYFDSSCIYTLDGKKYLSLQEQIMIDLNELGILKNNIYIDKSCTFMNSSLSSYRRDGSAAGRMISLLGDFNADY